jgi:hypothetical protein
LVGTQPRYAEFLAGRESDFADVRMRRNKFRVFANQYNQLELSCAHCGSDEVELVWSSNFMSTLTRLPGPWRQTVSHHCCFRQAPPFAVTNHDYNADSVTYRSRRPQASWQHSSVSARFSGGEPSWNNIVEPADSGPLGALDQPRAYAEPFQILLQQLDLAV